MSDTRNDIDAGLTNIAEGVGLAVRVVDLFGHNQVPVVVSGGHVVHSERLVGDRQIAVSRRFGRPVHHFFGYLQFEFVVFDSLFVLLERRVSVANVAVGATHAGQVVELLGDGQVRPVQFEGAVEVA